MRKIRFLTAAFIFIFITQNSWSQVSAVYGGGPFYSGGQSVMDDLRSSGFNTVILWTIHVGPNGNMNLNNIPVINTSGNYIGDPNWGNRVASLKQAPTSVNRIEIGVASAGVNDFANIESLINSQGTGPNTLLYKGFQNLKIITGADAINIDDESHYRVETMVKFSLMMADIGYKIAFVPYTRRSFWAEVFNQVESQRPGTIDRVYLQAYAGGTGNNPVTWNRSFGGLKVIPGLWSIHGSRCNIGDTPSQVQNQMANWQSSISGGFMWLYDDIQACNAVGRSTSDYAAAINNAVGMSSGFATNIAPDASVTVSSEYVNPNWSKEKLTDGIFGQDANGEWASDGEQTPYAQLDWNNPVEIDRVVLYDRPNPAERILAGTLLFNDGSAINVSELDNAGLGKRITFLNKTVTSVRFDVTNGIGPNVGLAEFEVFGENASTSAQVPGKIEAEDYIGFSDTTPNNLGRQYRNDSVDIENTTDIGGGYNIGWIDSNEWLEYPIKVTQAGNYRVDVRVASVPGNGMLTVEIDGQTPGDAINVEATGGWQNWITKSTSLGILTEGNKTLRVQIQSGLFNINWLDIIHTDATNSKNFSDTSP